MKQLTILFFLFFILSTGLKAQIWENIEYPVMNYYGLKKMVLKDIQGSPFLDPQYVHGEVTIRNGSTYKDVPLRYNCADDILEYKNGDKSYEIIPKDQVRRAEFGGRIFCYLNYAPVHAQNRGYFQLLTEGKASLYVRYHITFYESDDPKGYATPKPARFDDLKETYWISIDGAPVVEISKKNDLLNLFSDRKKEMQDFVSEQKLSYKKVEDLKKIVRYYNTL